MKNLFLIALAVFISIPALRAQDSTGTKKKGKFMETVKDVPDMLIAGKDNSADSSMYFLKNDNLTIRVTPKWQEVGTQTGNDLKLNKINEEPLDETFPLADKKLANGLIITMTTVKKAPDEKKKAILAQVKTDLAKLLKDNGRSLGNEEMDQTVNSMMVGLEPFTTDQGKQGELYYINDYASQQANFLVVLLIPGAKPNTCIQVQFDYLHYVYDNIPEDLSELRVFPYPDDQATYVDFTKKIMKTLKVE